MDNRIEESIFFIAKNFRTELVLEGLAREVGMSKFHFHRLFKTETGSTPLKYINKLKLEHAVHFLIMYPNSKQLEVAFESGYSSPVVFARIFKQFYGSSPMDFRKKKLGAKKLRKHQSKEYSHLDITYLKKKKIFVARSNLLANNLSNLYKKLIDKIEKPTYGIGFYIDTPIHTNLNECRYFAGLEDEQFGSSNVENSKKESPYFHIEEGYYTYFNIQGDFDSVNRQIIEYKETIIDPSPYQISSFIAIEKIKLPTNPSDFNYFSAVRTIYLKIERK